MINQPRGGLDPNGRTISKNTPNRPGIFLSKRAAEDHLAEYGEITRKLYRILPRGVRAAGWNLDVFVVVLKTWVPDAWVSPYDDDKD
jgi:hypothetical protein